MRLLVIPVGAAADYMQIADADIVVSSDGKVLKDRNGDTELTIAGRHTLVGGQVIANAHAASFRCRVLGCAIHNPTDHHMADWPQHFRDPREPFSMHPGLMERVCEHGVGHPDPDHMKWYAETHDYDETAAEGIHGCDGCCNPPEETT